MDTSETDNQRFVSRINAHVQDCQICQTGSLCDIAERIITDYEAVKAKEKAERQERKLRQAGL